MKASEARALAKTVTYQNLRMKVVVIRREYPKFESHIIDKISTLASNGETIMLGYHFENYYINNKISSSHKFALTRKMLRKLSFLGYSWDINNNVKW